MKKDRLRLYFLEVLLVIVLFLALFVSNIFSRKIFALILTILAIIIRIVVKKKKVISIYKNQVIWLMTGFATIYIIVFYLLGIYFGYYKSATPFSLNTIVHFIIPFTFIILSSELIRKTLITQKGRLSKLLVFIAMVLIDLIVYSGVYDIRNIDDMLTILGFIFFASIACNLLYNYIAIRFGVKGIIIYRLVTVLYVYFIPYIPNVYLFFRTFLRMLYPFLIFLILEYTYSKTNYATEYKDKNKNIIETTILIILMVIIVGLISCNFEYGILVIGSGSMTGSIDIGDAVIYKTYDNESIEVGTVIIYRRDDIQIVHRVIEVENVNGEYHYYTKGDANQSIDEGYVLKSDIEGITKFKISYIGYPSIWIHDIFS